MPHIPTFVMTSQTDCRTQICLAQGRVFSKQDPKLFCAFLLLLLLLLLLSLLLFVLFCLFICWLLLFTFLSADASSLRVPFNAHIPPRKISLRRNSSVQFKFSSLYQPLFERSESMVARPRPHSIAVYNTHHFILEEN